MKRIEQVQLALTKLKTKENSENGRDWKALTLFQFLCRFFTKEYKQEINEVRHNGVVLV